MGNKFTMLNDILDKENKRKCVAVVLVVCVVVVVVACCCVLLRVLRVCDCCVPVLFNSNF